MAEATVPLAVAAVALVYGRGVRRLWAEAGRGRIVPRSRAVAFAAGLAVVLVAVAPPLDSRADASLTAHMVQHVLLLAVAPPLLAIGGAVPAILRALPDRRRDVMRSWWRRVLRSQGGGAGWTTWVAVGLLLQTAVMWAWHLPALYEAAERIAPLHALEHVTFLSTATLFWYAIAGGRRSRHGVATLAVFVAGFPGTALGAALLLAPRPWYPHYAHGSFAAAMSDQQMAGVVMWCVGGLAYVVAAAVLVGTWLLDRERLAPSTAVSAAPSRRARVASESPS